MIPTPNPRLVLAALLAAVPLAAQPAPAPPATREAAVAELVATERRFSETCARVGFRASFLEFLADDGLHFAPGPTRMRDQLLAQPAEPEDFQLTWEPSFADVAASGDLGYTVGPYTVVENRGTAGQSERYGTFFSVWRRDATGAWKLANDAGVRSPERTTVRRVVTAPEGVPSSAAEAPRAAAALRELDAALLASSAGDRRAAYEPLIDPAARLHRSGAMPVFGREAILGFLDREGGSLTGEVLGAVASRAGDLGYSWGRYVLRPASGEPVEGYYVRMWKRTANGWRIVVDTANRVPPPSPGAG